MASPASSPSAWAWPLAVAATIASFAACTAVTHQPGGVPEQRVAALEARLTRLCQIYYSHVEHQTAVQQQQQCP